MYNNINTICRHRIPGNPITIIRNTFFANFKKSDSICHRNKSLVQLS